MKLAPAVVAALVVAAIATPALAEDKDPWVSADKEKHFVASSGVTGAGYLTASFFTDDVVARAVFAAGLGVAVGGGKEVLDAAGLGDPSFKDLTWDLVGTATTVAIAVTFDLALRSSSKGKK